MFAKDLASLAPDREALRRSAWRAALIGAGLGILLAIIWSFELVDSVIGDSVANAVLGANAKQMSLDGSGWGTSLLFGLATGLASTFTACNCVVFSCVAPLAQGGGGGRSVLRTIGWMSLGIVTVTATYGLVGTLLESAIPSLSDRVLPIGTGYPMRLVQATAVFVILGAICTWHGLASLDLVRSPLRPLLDRHAWLYPWLLGLMIGCFSVGRPFPLFRKLLSHLSADGQVWLGALTLSLQGLANTAVVLLILLLLLYGTGGRFTRWLGQRPNLGRRLTGISMMVGGLFFLAYWGLRVPSYFGIGWFPHMPWN